MKRHEVMPSTDTMSELFLIEFATGARTRGKVGVPYNPPRMALLAPGFCICSHSVGRKLMPVWYEVVCQLSTTTGSSSELCSSSATEAKMKPANLKLSIAIATHCGEDKHRCLVVSIKALQPTIPVLAIVAER